MLYRISVAERGLTGIANIVRSRLSGLDDLLQAGTVPLNKPLTTIHCLVESPGRFISVGSGGQEQTWPFLFKVSFCCPHEHPPAKQSLLPGGTQEDNTVLMGYNMLTHARPGGGGGYPPLQVLRR